MLLYDCYCYVIRIHLKTSYQTFISSLKLKVSETKYVKQSKHSKGYQIVGLYVGLIVTGKNMYNTSKVIDRKLGEIASPYNDCYVVDINQR